MNRIRIFPFGNYIEAALRLAEYERDEDEVVIAQVPNAQGFYAQGDTFEEAQAMAADAIRCYIEGCIVDGEEVPVEHGYAITQRIPVQVSAAKA